jgi:hypothetical protein
MVQNRLSTASARFLGVVVLVLCLTQGGGGSAQAEPSLNQRRQAEAGWTLHDRSGNRTTYVDIAVVQVTNELGAVKTSVHLSHGWCKRVGKSSTFCHPTLEVDRIIPNADFDFEDSLESAVAKFRLRGVDQSVAWSASAGQGLAELERPCSESPAGNQAVGAYRASDASANLLGHRLTSADLESSDSADLTLMVGFATC